jgi:hypothetical protein
MLGHKIPDSVIVQLKNSADVYLEQLAGKLEPLNSGAAVARISVVDTPDILCDLRRAEMERDNIVYAQINPTYSRCYEYFPSRYFENAPIEGRPFIHGIFDCFTLVKDWFVRTHKIDLLWNHQRPFKWWETQDSLYLENASASGFIPQVGLVKPGDVLTFALGTSTVNHAAVYLGNSTILHHLGGRFSCKQILTPGLSNFRRSTWRHKGLIT